jgi:peroxiredoxin
MAEPSPRVEPPRRRRPLGKRQSTIFAVTLGLALVVAIVVGVLLASGSGDETPRAVTLSGEDADAPAELIQAAQAIGFDPPSLAGSGSIEDEPASAANGPTNTKLLPVGSPAPDFTLSTPVGRKVDLSDYRGKVVLLEFYAAWCPHCAAEAPHLAALAKSMGDDDYAFLAVNADNESAASVLAYHVYFELPFPALLDPIPGSDPVDFPAHGSLGPVSRAYQVAYFPTFYVIDRDGRIAWGSDGEQPDALIRQQLQRAAAA